MKRTDLEKHKGLKIKSQMQGPATAGRPKDAAISRREQRERDRALGLVPFAVKLNGELVKRLQDLAQERRIGLNELVGELLQKGLDNGG
ncbi:MAG: hypothetical protein ACOY5C_01405 [Pseudomonadota bacterium]|uniref:hypothetical protein n=1 Tax=Thermithiobacillus tepidarius TaxID=929 RepID=UPI0003FE00F2|nr:hypothetical protein [Thermithiobacillus tepidarius]